MGFVCKSTKLLLVILLVGLLLNGCDLRREDEDITYTITFETNGGSMIEPITVAQGTPFSFPFPPTKFDHVFDGWYLDNGTFKDQVFAGEITRDMVVYAKWIAPMSWEGRTMLFGEYPQSIKEDHVIISDIADDDGYYLGSDGARYAMHIARPYAENYTFSSGYPVVSQTVYYFKVEPIRWRILQESDQSLLIVADIILDNQRYDGSSNNYAESEIRGWLNDTFYTTAFNEVEQANVLTTHVVNTVFSTGYTTNPYVSENTNDKVFLLSYKEATNPNYGLHFASARRYFTSDYSRSRGVWMNTSGFYGYSGWCLRSPSRHHMTNVRSISEGGNHYDVVVYSTGFGIVPAIRIKPSSTNPIP